MRRAKLFLFLFLSNEADGSVGRLPLVTCINVKEGIHNQKILVLQICASISDITSVFCFEVLPDLKLHSHCPRMKTNILSSLQMHFCIINVLPKPVSEQRLLNNPFCKCTKQNFISAHAKLHRVVFSLSKIVNSNRTNV